MSLHAGRSAAFLVIGLALSSCGGDDGGICQPLGGGISATASVGSSFSNAPLAADRDLNSFATLQPATAGSGSGTFRATSGNQAANGFAGVLLGGTPAGQSTQITITTYLDGVQQDSNTAGTNLGGNSGSICSGICAENGGDSIFFGIAVSRAYDAIEATLQVNGGSSAVRIVELCKR